MVQQISYSQEIKELGEKQEFAAYSTFKTLHPFPDKNYLIRFGERIQQSTLPYQTRLQMIRSANHHLTMLILSAEHLNLPHAGPQFLIASLREKYWIPRIRNLMRKTIHQCLNCYKLNAQATQQLIGELPPTRLQPSRPFLNTGVD